MKAILATERIDQFITGHHIRGEVLEMSVPQAFRFDQSPDPFNEEVAAIIRACCGRKEAVARLRRWAGESVIESDHNRFVAAAEETLAGIHEGILAPYRIRPSEFMSWNAPY